jgi:hypothetical protein
MPKKVVKVFCRVASLYWTIYMSWISSVALAFIEYL